MFKPKLQQEQGFTMVEVLVAILISLMFVAIAMETMVVAAIFRARAQELTDAKTWIQVDIEEVKLQANQYNDPTKCSIVTPDNGYADGLRDEVIGSYQSGSFIEPAVLKTSRTSKQFNLTRTTEPSSITVGAPSHILKISYDISPTSGGVSIAKFYTEVIPDAALQCP